jgi:2-(1,2-epoxy-1,2-dihydrophenyl)acetyl-CoA isomerase
MGLVSKVVDRASLLDEALSTAHRFENLSPDAVRMTKRLVRHAYRSTFAETLELSALMQSMCHKTDNHIEAVSAVLERRAPNFN